MSDEAERGAQRRVKPNLIDVTVPNPARVVDFLHGGWDNFAVDRKASRVVTASLSDVERMPGELRAFRGRVITYLVEAGVRQFLEVGNGITPLGETHQVAQALDPRCRVLYTESDPLLLSRVKEKTRSAPGKGVSWVDGDIADVDAVIAGATPTLDLSRPVGLLLMGTLAHVPTTIAATRAISSLLAPLPPGSYVAIYHLASDLDPDMPGTVRHWNKTVPVPVTLRSRADLLLLVEGLDLVEPGVVPVTHWHRAAGETAEAIPVHGVVARKR